MLLSRMHRTLRHDEAGQALVLGAIAMLVLALGVMTMVQFGHVINERVRVQNAADNAAFSTAAVVARSLNFIAWVNRTIVTQYVAAMAVQSIIAVMDGLQAVVGIVSDMLQTMSSIACGIARICTICCPIPWTAAFCCPCATILNNIYPILQQAAQVLRTVADGIGNVSSALDTPAALFVKGIALYNRWGMYNAQNAMRWMTRAVLVAPLADNFQRKIMRETAGKTNDGGTGVLYNGAMTGLNGIASYWNLFDQNGSEKIPDGGTYYSSKVMEPEPKQNAERLMAEITNASRTGPSNGPGPYWESGHGLVDGKKGVLGAVASVAKFIGGPTFEGASRLVDPMPMDTFREESGNAAGVPPPDMEAGAKKCEKGKQDCDNATSAYESAKADYNAKQSQCSSDTSACSSSGDPDSSACKAKKDSCNAANDARDEMNDRKDAMDDACGKVDSACKGGAGDLGNVGGGGQSWAGKKNYVFMNYMHLTQFTRGSALASAEFAEAKMAGLSYISGGGTPKIVGIQAAYKSQDRYHCKYDGRKLYNVPSCPQYAWTKPVKCKQESMHEFQGMTRYVSFKIEDKPKQFFNQPDFWAMVNKTPDDARFPADVGMGFTKKLSIDFGGQTGTMDATKPGLESMLAGLNGYARSQVYYHRPGAWSEPPNLFNPFWRAKLAPIQPKLSTLTGKLGALGGGIDQLLSQLLVH